MASEARAHTHTCCLGDVECSPGSRTKLHLSVTDFRAPRDYLLLFSLSRSNARLLRCDRSIDRKQNLDGQITDATTTRIVADGQQAAIRGEGRTQESSVTLASSSSSIQLGSIPRSSDALAEVRSAAVTCLSSLPLPSLPRSHSHAQNES